MTISIHAPVKGATTSVRTRQVLDFYFNPRSREGSDAKTSFRYPYLIRISIHAPVKGATEFIISICKISKISIHAPVKGATGIILYLAIYHAISIHAPVKGATPMRRLGLLYQAQFQSTLP